MALFDFSQFPDEQDREQSGEADSIRVANPAQPHDEESSSTKCWKVIGGVGKGGILVREGCSLASPQQPERLSTGACMEELSLRGDRLQYRLISGTGPITGWVSTRLNGKELVIPPSSSGGQQLAAEPNGSSCFHAKMAKCLHTKTAGRLISGAGNIHSEANADSHILDPPPPRHVAHSVPVATWDTFRSRVRKRALRGWGFETRGLYVSPPQNLGSDGSNPVSALGECADPTCGCYRLRTPQVRASFAEYCVDKVSLALPPLEKGMRNGTEHAQQLPISYISVGAGALYFDWEFLERLRDATGVSIARITLIDSLYAKPDLHLRKAIQQFRDWYAGATIKLYSSVSSFLNQEFPGTRVLPHPHGESASITERAIQLCSGTEQWYQVLMQCDAVQVDEEDRTSSLSRLRVRALQPGGLIFKLSNPPVRTCWQRQMQGTSIDTVESAEWRHGRWGCSQGVSRKIEVMPPCSWAHFATNDLWRWCVHMCRVAVLRGEYPNMAEAVPEEAVDWSDMKLGSFFNHGGYAASMEEMHELQPAAYRLLADFVVRKASLQSATVVKAKREKGSLLHTTGKVFVGKLGGKWVEECLENGAGGSWHLIFGPGFGLTAPLLQHLEVNIDELLAWQPHKRCESNL
eukprot:TRINITY_DN93663_c0_g1_i1.p1 TRINITY_DN93663_c0_g1~~TRINITY_DN93663_c0_g1_i1.p1  ORF type:complete len:634 (+),score=75.13 TRINITY_DN93663_c0_g1_i1:114-2015(+)